MRVVVDSTFSLPGSARLLAPPGAVLVAGAVDTTSTGAALAASGAELISLPGPQGRVDLGALLAELGARGVNELHVEAGAVLNGALLRDKWVDEVLLYLAPRLLGPGRSMLELPELQVLENSLDLAVQRLGTCGPDIVIRAQTPAGALLRDHVLG